MSKYIIFLLLLLLVITLVVVNEKFKPTNALNPLNPLTLKDNVTSETHSTEKNGRNKKRNCNYSVKWESDMDMFNNKEIETNPFAKSDAEHCRTGFQCKSGKCNQFYCDQ